VDNHQRVTVRLAVRLCGLLAAIAAVALFTGCVFKTKCDLRMPSDDDAAAISETLTAEQARQFERSERIALSQDHFLSGRDYERRGMHDMAWQMYEIAFEFWPRDPFLRKLLSDRHMRSNDPQKALTLFFRDGETIADLTSDEKRALSLIYLRMGDLAKATEAVEALGADMSEEEMYSIGLLYGSKDEDHGNKGDRTLVTLKEFFARNPRSADMGLRLVQQRIGIRKFEDAENLAVILRSAYPRNAEVAGVLGMVKHMQGDTAAAIGHFNDALALDSLNEESLRTLGHIHLMRDEYQEAASYYRRLTAQKDIGVIYRRGLAILLFHMKEFPEAEKLLDTLIAGKDSMNIPPAMHELHLYRGLLYSQTKRRAKAAAEMRAAIAIRPKYEDAWKELCYIYILEKDKVNANKVVEEYAAAFPNTASVWRFRGYALRMQEKYDEAVAALRKAVEIEPDDHFSWFEIGNIQADRKRYAEAADAFKQVLRLRPGEPVASNNLGYMWTEMGVNLDSAKALIKVALRHDSTNGAYLDSYAWVYYKLGDYEKALHYMNEALKQEEMLKEPVTYEHLGDIYFKMEDYTAAEKAYRQAIKLKTEDAARINGRLKEIRELLQQKKER